MNIMPAKKIARTVQPARWKYEDNTASTIPTARNERAKISPINGQMLLGFSFRSLGADLLMEPEWTPRPKRNGSIAARVIPTSITLCMVTLSSGENFSTAGLR